MLGTPQFLRLTITSSVVRPELPAYGQYQSKHVLPFRACFHSFTSFNGTRRFGNRVQRIVLGACSIALIGLGLFFVVDALKRVPIGIGAMGPVDVGCFNASQRGGLRKGQASEDIRCDRETTQPSC